MRRAVRAALLLLPPLLLLLAGDARAGDEEGWRDAFFGVAFKPTGLVKSLELTDVDTLFCGKCGPGVRVRIGVRESGEARDGAAWRKIHLDEFAKAKRKIERVAGEGARLLFSEKRLGVFDTRHGYAFVVRGPVCFVVHAWVDDAVETTDRDIAAALDAFHADADPGCGLLALRIARQSGKEPDDPAVLLRAGLHYLEGDLMGNRSDVLAAGLLGRARRAAKPDTFEKRDRWLLLRFGGESLLRTGRADEAAAWLADAVAVAAPSDVPITHYDLARAEAATGRIDEAFAALDRAFDRAMPVSRGQVSAEPCFEVLRRESDRWEAFWRRRIDAR
jgi:hypothetical protein